MDEEQRIQAKALLERSREWWKRYHGVFAAPPCGKSKLDEAFELWKETLEILKKELTQTESQGI